MKYSPWGHKESDTSERLTHTQTHTHTCKEIKEGMIAMSHQMKRNYIIEPDENSGVEKVQ